MAPCLEVCYKMLTAAANTSTSNTLASQLSGAHLDCSGLCSNIHTKMAPLPMYWGPDTPYTGDAHYARLSCNPFEKDTKCNWPLLHWVIMWAVALVADVCVLTFHVTVPPHPKFLLRLPRLISIRDHAISGAVEILAGVTAFFLNDPKPAVMVQLVAALCFHLPATIYQTPNVFGVRIVMVPAYALVALCKLIVAINLMMDMYSIQKLIMLVMVHHIYVWCRCFMFLFSQVGILRSHEYTVSILLAGFLSIPAVLGPSGNLYATLILAFYMLVAIPCMHLPKEERKALLTEAHRDMFKQGVFREKLDDMSHEVQKNLDSAISMDEQVEPHALPENIAYQVFHKHDHIFKTFEKHDSDADDCLDGSHKRDFVLDILAQTESPGIRAALKRLERQDSITEHDLARVLRSHRVGKHIEQWSGDQSHYDDILNAKSGAERAKLVFLVLDEDNSNYLTELELGRLLSYWGMPEEEAIDTIIEVCGKKRCNYRVSFDEFQKHFAPLWKFAFYEMQKQVQKRQRLLKRQTSLERLATMVKTVSTLKTAGNNKVHPAYGEGVFT